MSMINDTLQQQPWPKITMGFLKTKLSHAIVNLQFHKK
jgi:hypothetical protein